MTDKSFARTNANVAVRTPPGAVMMDAAAVARIPWTSNPLLPGLDSKYVHVDLVRGTSVILMRFGPGVQFPVHAHFGSALLFCLKGRFSYPPAGAIGPGGFGYEPIGVVHEPDATDEEETIVWVVNSNNQVTTFFNEDGSPGVTSHLAYNLKQIARNFGMEAVAHLDVPEGFWEE